MDRRDVLDMLRLAGIVGFLATVFVLAFLPSAHAFDHGFDKNDPFNKWAESLKVPPGYTGSCCGLADLYGIKIIKEATGDTGDDMGVAVVTDGDPIQFPDGTHRPAIKNGTTFKFGKSQINTKQGNPTFNAFGFLSPWADEYGDGRDGGASGLIVRCIIPEQQGL